MRVRPGVEDSVIDTEDGLVVEEAAPGRPVVVTTQVNAGGQAWACRGEYVAGVDGVVVTSHDPSVRGTYQGVDPYGLVWGADAGRIDLASLDPMRIAVTAKAGDDVADAAFERRWVREGVHVSDISHDGLVGRLHLPASDGMPGLVVVGGSDGGLGGPAYAALLANHGVAALSLAYWNHPGLPDSLHDIDVELVGRACDWLRARNGVRDERPTVIGISRGGELAMLAGSLMPERVGSVIGLVGSGVAWGAVGTGDDNDTAWRFGGRAVTQMYEWEDEPDRGLEDPVMVAAAEIPVERIDGRLLLLTGQDDALWRSTMLSELAVHRAERFGAAERVTHVSYPEAGHFCCTPPGFAIQAGSALHPVDGMPFVVGGTRAGNQAARLGSWRRIREFLGV
jgi:pimeloyl-ACP methyl ester carboxylesterase